MTTPFFPSALPSALLRAGVAAALAASLAAFAGEHKHPGADAPSDAQDAHAAHDEHAAHGRAAAVGPTRSVTAYAVPRVSLVRHDGRAVDLAADLDDGRPVFLNFIYTTCTAICPPMSQVFAEFQQRLGAERERVRLVSVSIDPEHDTPRRLTEYAQRFGAGPQWTFYTGSVASSVAVQKAFGAYRGDKMNHTPLTLFRAAPGQSWVRLDGFATPQQLLQEYREASK